MKKFSIFVAICLILLCACNNSNPSSASNDNSSKVAELESENLQLKKENDELKKENERLNEALNKKQEETSVKDEDVTVKLTEKASKYDKWEQPYIDLVFAVTNNTEKEIKGIQGISDFKDMFGADIIRVNCDFTGKAIKPGETITVDDLSIDCNQFIDSHMKLYNTDLDDLQFNYEVTAIVFTDGTTKTA